MRLALVGLVAAVGASLAQAGDVSFAVKPSATKTADGKVRIEFAVSRETDVSVCIEDGQGRIVRRLASGVLGTNAPAPLKPGLAQSIEWDGKADWKKPAPPGPYKVRVMLGLGAKYDKEAMAAPLSIGDVQTMATGPDGTRAGTILGRTSITSCSFSSRSTRNLRNGSVRFALKREPRPR